MCVCVCVCALPLPQAGPLSAPAGPAGAAEADGGSCAGAAPDQRAALPGHHPLHAARARTLRAPDHRHLGRQDP